MGGWGGGGGGGGSGGVAGDVAVKNKNGRLSLNTMTSFLSLTACITQAGKEEREKCPFGTD